MQKNAQPMWVWDEACRRIVQREVTYVPGLYKIFDELLVNAADNKQRDASMRAVRVTIDKESGEISVWNDGKGIPVVMHGEHGVYVPELIFGHLLTSSNYDDGEKKVTGGRNGYGAKLANIFSSRFVIETCDTERGFVYRQEFSDNMTVKGEPVIGKCRKSDSDFTCITFSPDLERFGMDGLDDDIVALFTKRVYDMAGISDRSVSVYLNGSKLPVRDFQSYVALYRTDADKEAEEAAGVTSPAAAAASASSSAAKADDEFDSDDESDSDSDAGPRRGKKPKKEEGSEVPGTVLPRLFVKVSDRWEVAVAVSDGQFTQVSFVNAICTTRGGSHVKMVADQVADAVCKAASRKNKGVPLKAHHVRNHLTVFVNSLVENPAFDSQTKDTLITTAKSFGSECVLPDKFLKQVVAKSGVVDRVLSWAKFKQSAELKRKGGSKTRTLSGIPKLDDANNAGTARAHQCTLILTEGDSAKALAISGLSVVGRDNYGVFPLKGKLLNVREASHKQILANAEIQNLVKIMGLQFGKKYDSADGLRYGHLMIMADQDHDGSHIKGLIINFLHHFWPSLLEVDGFLQQFITPIVKVTRGSRALSFFTLPEYRVWREANSNGRGWAARYYKGLGTSSAKEAKEYFADLDTHVINFEYDERADRRAGELSDDEEDEEEAPEADDDAGSSPGSLVASSSCGAAATAASGSAAARKGKKGAAPSKATFARTDPDLIDLAFSKKRADDRKAWLQRWKPETHVDYAVASMPVGTFVDRELILFSRADNERSIPSFVDGLKPSQRKVLYACFKRGLKKDIKVAQLAGYVAEHSAYHHGEASLAATIVGMAQDFVGANNINMLVPSGQFGTRIMGGKDAASPRYVFTRLHQLARLVFPADDDALLRSLTDDGQVIEPEYYFPIIPLALINGADGIGTGWSSFVPPFSPREVIAAVRDTLQGHEPAPLRPWYRGFEGAVVETKPGQQFCLKGKYHVSADGTTLTVTELPVRRWTQDFKIFLESLTPQAEKEREKAAKTKPGAKGAAAAKKKAAAATAARKKKAAGKDDDGDDSDADSVASSASAAKPASAALVKEFRENHTDTTVFFTITLTPEGRKVVAAGEATTRKKFRLDATLSTTNMHLFDESGRIRRFGSPAAILARFVPLRLDLYNKRRAHMMRRLRAELGLLEAKESFIEAVLDGRLVVSRRSRADVVADLLAMGLKPRRSGKVAGGKAAATSAADGDEDEDDVVDAAAVADDASSSSAASADEDFDEDVIDTATADAAAVSKGFHYLLGMSLMSLTAEKVVELRAEREAKSDEVRRLESTTAADLWDNDLAALEEGLDADDAERAALVEVEERARRRAQGGGGGKRGKKGAAAKAAVSAKAGAAKRRAQAAKALKGTTAARVESEEESGEEGEGWGDESDGDFAAPAVKPRSRAAASRSRRAPTSRAGDDGDDAEPAARAKTTSRRAAARAPSPAPAAEPEDEFMALDLSDSDDEGGVASLAARIAQRVAITPPSKQSKSQKRAAQATKRAADVSDEEDEESLADEEETPEPQPRRRAAAAKKPAAKKPAAKKRGGKRRTSDERAEAAEASPPMPKASPAPKRSRAAPKRKAAPAAEAKDSDESEAADESPSPKARPARRRAAAARKTYDVGASDEESDASEDFVAEDDSDDEVFELDD